MHYLIRIELHNTHDYQPLHAAMAKRSLTRTIVAGDGTQYELPTGSYHYQGNSTAENVRVAAAAAAKEVGHTNPAIVVAESSSITWTGLSVVAKKRSA